MSHDQWIVLAVTLGSLVLFVTERIPVDLTSLLALLVLVFSGVLTISEGVAGLANSALITVACMFILSAGLIRTGALDVVTRGVFAVGQGSRRRLVVALFVTVTLLSAFINNTPVCVMFLPIVLGVCSRLDIAPSRLLMPLSFATILGGTCTLIGTSTNVLVSQAAERRGLPPIGMFEMTVPGVIYAVAGLAFLGICGPKLLPRRASVSSAMAAGKIREFVTEVQFPAGSALLGKSFQEVLGRTPGLTALMVIRGDETYTAPLISNPRTQFIRAGDVLLLKGEPGAINDLLRRDGVTLPPELGAALAGKGKAVTLVELVINPNSPLIGRTIGGVDFSRHHGGAAVMAILRRDEHLRERVSDIRLRMGDTLLVVCDEAHLDDLRQTSEFILLEGVDREVLRRDKAPVAALIMLALVVLDGFQVLPITTLALGAVALMVLTGCLPLKLAYAAIDSSCMVVLVGMLALGFALEKTQIAHLASVSLVNVLRDHGPTAVLAGIYLLAMVITSLISNNAVAVLLTPLSLETAQHLGLQPAPFLFAVLFGSSACYATPIGYQTNMFVYGPGGYRFSDYLRVGVPLNAVLFAVAMIVIPWWFPFVPLAAGSS